MKRPAPSLAQLASAVDRLLAVDRVSVAVTTTPSFAALWLAPKLAKFQLLEPAIDVRVDASEARVNLEREGMDLAVRLYPVQPGDEGPPPLLQEQALLVAAPAVAARIHSAADILSTRRCWSTTTRPRAFPGCRGRTGMSAWA
jgi:LysR family glycine cleavage system transcriptional activator